MAIIIDAWGQLPPGEYTEEIPLKCAKNIVEFCTTWPEISAVSLSGYSHDQNYDAYYEKKWITNSDIFFSKETKWDFLKTSWNAIHWNNDCRNHNIIKKMEMRIGQTRFIALYDYHILYYCQYIDPTIKNIYFLGQSWDHCLKFRSVGWLRVAALQYHNFLSKEIKLKTHRRCVWCGTHDPAKIMSPWTATEDPDIFELDLNQIQW